MDINQNVHTFAANAGPIQIEMLDKSELKNSTHEQSNENTNVERHQADEKQKCDDEIILRIQFE